VVTTFLEFALHVLSQQERGELVPKDKEWKHSNGYIKWFYRVSHPIIVRLAPIPEYIVPKPVYQEVIVVQKWARDPPDPFQVIGNMKARV